ncbi:MAG: ATP-binding protein [Pyrinomonadaceae bacterium]
MSSTEKTNASQKALHALGAINPDLGFLADLGRNLLIEVHPKKIASRTVSALTSQFEVRGCAVAMELQHFGLVVVESQALASASPTKFQRNRFKKWLGLLPSQIPFENDAKADRFLECDESGSEYVVPFQVNGEIKGAIVLALGEQESLSDADKQILDTATQIVAMSINLTARYEATLDTSINRAKEEHRKFTESVLDALPVSLYVIDRDYNIVMWNRHREIGIQGMPRDAVIGRNVFEVLSKYPKSKLSGEFDRAFRSGRIERIEQQTTDDDGATKHWMVSKVPMKEDNGDVSHVITVGEDVTMRVEAIHAVGRAEKLAAVGRLASGVVHEINNPLATISACAEALESRVAEGAFADSPDLEDLREYLGLIRSEAFRCKTITNGLLDFSRVRTGNRHEVDIREVIESSARLISHQKRGENIEIRIEADEVLPPVIADEGQIQQAIIALATNAIDAMPEGGVLTFRAHHLRKRILIEVADTGMGIDPEDISKIFEPFFTTKEVGKGTGLGLAVCYGIITDHEGRLSVKSNPGIGTTFSISLPLKQTKYRIAE